MGAVFIVVILVLLAIGGVIFGVVTRQWGGWAVAGGAGLLAIIVLFFSSFASVGTSDVGVETAFGKTVGDLSPGPHLKPPWDNVTAWDDSVQVVSYGRDQNQNKPDHCLLVRIGGGQSACLTLTFAYQVKPSASDALFKAYRGNQARMNDYLIVRTLDSDLNSRLETYSPIEALAKVGTGPGAAAKSQAAAALSPIARLVETDLGHLIGGDIIVRPHALVIPYVAFDPQTQARLNRYQASIADTFIAAQNIQTASKQAAAAKILHSQISNDPNVVAYFCMANIAEAMVKQNMNPAGFNCWQGGGGGSTVVVPKP
jgi:regulator of protease activity HflC (stomatin/prohibitin superfamily)